MAKHGEYDGASFWGYNAEREIDFYYSDVLIEGPIVFWHLKSYKFDWNTFEDLRGISIGAMLGEYYGDEFKNAEKSEKIRVERVPKEVQNFLKILAERIQIFPLDQEVVMTTEN